MGRVLSREMHKSRTPTSLYDAEGNTYVIAIVR
jgi:hypothetical protein